MGPKLEEILGVMGKFYILTAVEETQVDVCQKSPDCTLASDTVIAYKLYFNNVVKI